MKALQRAVFFLLPVPLTMAGGAGFALSFEDLASETDGGADFARYFEGLESLGFFPTCSSLVLITTSKITP